MKKRAICIAAAVCAISLICTAAVTGCKADPSEQPSVEVTEAEWNEAFKKTLEAKNFTAKTTTEGLNGDGGTVYSTTMTYALDNIAYEEMTSYEKYEGKIYKDDVVQYFFYDDDFASWARYSMFNDIPKDMSKYTFSEGQYVTEYEESDYGDGCMSTIVVTVKIGKDGYLSYLTMTYDYIDDDEKVIYTVTFTNFGTTKYTPPKDANFYD